MRTVCKFEFELHDIIRENGNLTKEIPRDAKFIHVSEDKATNSVCVWAIVDDHKQYKTYNFHIRATGHSIDPKDVYIGTAVLELNKTGFHVFLAPETR